MWKPNHSPDPVAAPAAPTCTLPAHNRYHRLTGSFAEIPVAADDAGVGGMRPSYSWQYAAVMKSNWVAMKVAALGSVAVVALQNVAASCCCCCHHRCLCCSMMPPNCWQWSVWVWRLWKRWAWHDPNYWVPLLVLQLAAVLEMRLHFVFVKLLFLLAVARIRVSVHRLLPAATIHFRFVCNNWSAVAWWLRVAIADGLTRCSKIAGVVAVPTC